MRKALAISLCVLALPAAAAAATVPTPDPILGTWQVTRTGTDTAPTVYGAIRVTGGPDAFVGTVAERTFLMGDAGCALAAGKQVWSLRRIAFESGSSTRVRYEGTSVQPYGDSSIGCPEKAFDAWWVVSLTNGEMSFSMPIWNRTHGLERVDTTPPRADAQPGSVAAGRASSLNFAASEESGWAHFTVRVLRGARVLVNRSYDHVFSTSTGETQTIMWTPSRSVRGPLRLCVSAVDGSGNRSAESCATITVRSGAATAGRPRVTAYPVSASSGEKVRLRWRMGDDSGLLRLTITVHRPGGRTIAMDVYRDVSARLPGEAHFVYWNQPPNPASHYTFCISVRDAGGKRARDCAKITIGGSRRAVAAAATYPARVKILQFVDQEGMGFDPVDIFDGKLSSRKAACVKNRLVSLYRRRPGPDLLIGRMRASDEGFWFLNREDPGSGTYYARVARKTVGPRGHRAVCLAATSPARVFEDA